MFLSVTSVMDEIVERQNMLSEQQIVLSKNQSVQMKFSVSRMLQEQTANVS